MAKDPSPQIVIANELGSGRVVFLAKGASSTGVAWAALIDDAEVAEDQARADEILALAEAEIAAKNEVMDAYLIDVAVESGGLRPTKYREEIRALGPTVRADLGKQSEGASA